MRVEKMSKGMQQRLGNHDGVEFQPPGLLGAQ